MATEWTFEKAMARLEQIVTTLEGGRCPLEDSMKLFEEGTRLTAYCAKLLREAEQKIVNLTEEQAPPEQPTPPADEML